MSDIRYPYLPPGRIIRYASADDPLMREAKEFARVRSRDLIMPNASLVVKGGAVIGRGANGSLHHDLHGCARIRLGCKSGEGYDLCEGCHPRNHSEATSIADTLARGNNPASADLYLWGHWWCCKACWDVMTAAEIRDVWLLDGSERLFNKESADNVIGRQFKLP